MVRVSDTIKEIRSYVLFRDGYTKKLRIKGSHWLPGYTAAHKATPLEVIEFELNKQHADIDQANKNVEELLSMYDDIVAENIQNDIDNPLNKEKN